MLYEVHYIILLSKLTIDNLIDELVLAQSHYIYVINYHVIQLIQVHYMILASIKIDIT